MSTFRKFFSHSRTEISHAFLTAKPIFSGSGIKILRAPNEFSKFLVVIPRKSGNSCERNRFRRRVKSLFYEEKWHNQPDFWIIIAYPRALALNFDALKALLQKTFVSSIKETIE